MSTAVLTKCSVIDFDPEGKESAKLTINDRCDRCGTTSQAYVLVTLNSGGQLAFCAHHAAKYREALLPISAEWYSETKRLIENRKQGSEN